MSTQQAAHAPIEILLVSDSNYAAFLATTLVSILENAAPEDVLHFHIVDGGMTRADLDKIEAIGKSRACEMTFYKPNLRKYFKYFRKDIQTFPVVVNYRLFLAQYLPKTIDKVLYLDVDLIVRSSLRELWETPIGDAFIAAAADRDIDPEHVRNLQIEGKSIYFNSGIMLVNVKKWREEPILEELLEIALEIREKIILPDQDVLNVYAAKTGYFELDMRWNCHPKYFEKVDPVIIHYMGDRRRIPMLDVLYSYAEKTPYGKLPMQTTWYRVKRWCKKKRCQFVCMFLWKKEWRRAYRNRQIYR